MNPRFIDTHSHVNFRAFREDKDEVIRRALDSGVWMINAGTMFETSRKAVEMADEYSDGVYAAVALHPIHLFEHHVDEEESGFNARGEEFDLDAYKDLVLRSPKVVGIGEFGLDYYHLPKDMNEKIVKAKQEEVAISHIELAKAVDKPVMIHCRPSEGTMDAYEDIIKILDSHYFSHSIPSTHFEIHCFTGNLEIAQKFVKRGGYIALNGIITFDKTGRSEKVVKNLPLENTILETDCPYLTPLPHRGKRNEPSYVKHVAEKIAEFKGVSVDEVAETTTKNARELYKI